MASSEKICLRKMDRHGLTELHPCEARLCEKGRAWSDFLKAFIGHALSNQSQAAPLSFLGLINQTFKKTIQGTAWIS